MCPPSLSGLARIPERSLPLGTLSGMSFNAISILSVSSANRILAHFVRVAATGCIGWGELLC